MEHKSYIHVGNTLLSNKVGWKVVLSMVKQAKEKEINKQVVKVIKQGGMK